VTFHVTYLLGKIRNIEYCNFLKKAYSKKSYHVRRFMTFKPNDQRHDHNHSIVCLNDPIFCNHIRLGMTNNVDVGSFHFRCTKNSFSIFQVQKKWVIFAKHVPNFTFIIIPTHSSKLLDYFVCTIHLFV
jgi:hypothetical protein